MTETAVKTRVRYAETDMMGVVNNSNYLVWFELGRAAYMRGLGVPYTDVEEKGFYLPITEFSCRIASPARYDEELQIKTRIVRLRSRSVTFGYSVERDGTKLAEGETTHICLGAGKRSTTIPPWLMDKLGSST